MYTFLLILLALLIISFCTKKLIKDSFGRFCIIMIACFATALINGVYFAFNIKNLPTKQQSFTYEIEDSVKIYTKNYEDIYIDSEEFDRRLKLDNIDNVYLSDKNKIVKICHQYDVDNKWLFGDMFVDKKIEWNVYLNRKNYELLKFNQYYAEKRKKSLQKND